MDKGGVMKCLDAVEGNVKAILEHIFKMYVDDRLDDSDYIRTVKTVLTGTERFIRDNREITPEPDILLEVLYSYSKDLWLERIRERRAEESETADEEEGPEDDVTYHNYYYDYIYHTGTYPR
jgi:plasmid maintenance system antidote protein VapI